MNRMLNTALLCAVALTAPGLRAADDILIVDLEGTNHGDWRVEATAFGNDPARGALPGQMEATGLQGKGLVDSFLSGDGPTSVPSLDEMAGDWIPAVNVVNPPAIHNFHDMLLVGRDLTSVFCYPEDWLWQGAPRRGYPPVTLTLDGREFSCEDYRWLAYRALRRNLDGGGLAVESDTRMINEP